MLTRAIRGQRQLFPPAPARDKRQEQLSRSTAPGSTPPLRAPCCLLPMLGRVIPFQGHDKGVRHRKKLPMGGREAMIEAEEELRT